MQSISIRADDPKCNCKARLAYSRYFLVALLLVATLCLFVMDARAQHQIRQSGTLTLVIRPQIELQESGTDLVLKIRLAEGTNVKLWAGNSCDSPSDDSKNFSASGTYRVSLQDLSTEGKAYVCAASSDGLLKGSRPLQN